MDHEHSESMRSMVGDMHTEEHRKALEKAIELNKKMEEHYRAIGDDETADKIRRFTVEREKELEGT